LQGSNVLFILKALFKSFLDCIAATMADHGSPTFSSLLSSGSAPVVLSSSDSKTGSHSPLSEVKLSVDPPSSLTLALTSQLEASEAAADHVHAFDGVDMVHPDGDEEPPYRVPKKHLALSLLLLTIGIGCTGAGIDYLVSDKAGGFALLLVGAIVLIPR
jgi:hypothetical protein